MGENLKGTFYDVDIPTMLGSDVVVSDFWQSEHRNMLLEYDNDNSARMAWQRYKRYINRHKLPIRAKTIGKRVYLIKIIVDSKGGTT